MKFIIALIVLIAMLGYSSAPANNNSSTVIMSPFPGVPTTLWKNNTDLIRPSHCFLGDPEYCGGSGTCTGVICYCNGEKC
ncbi:hypothetical protein BJ166DRAFT_589492 [Pestalotiopsis sp. NC0098]|nr:hypothetical protein BJ166DRAFT_589492 [Pestalotiopsis sp. NC0098]